MTSRDELDTPLKVALQRLTEATPNTLEMQSYVDEVRRVAGWALNSLLAADDALKAAYASRKTEEW